MNMHWWDDVSETLTRWNIRHEVDPNGQGIMVDRDSIIANTIAQDEQAHYDRLLIKLRAEFPFRFHYGAKTDEWLLLQTIV